MAENAKRQPWWQRGPRRLRVTSTGRLYVLMTLGVGFGALNTGNNLLYLILGFLLAVIVLSGVLSERVVKDLRVRRLLPAGVYANAPCAIRYEVTHAKGNAFSVRLTEMHSSIAGSVWIPTITKDDPTIAKVDSTAPRRGPLQLEGITVSTLFPFGLFEKSRDLFIRETLPIWPRQIASPKHMPAPVSVAERDMGTIRSGEGSGEFSELREFHEGEEVKQVHWRKSASAGRLIRILRENERQRLVTLSIEAEATRDATDRRCEETAALARQLLAAGHSVGLQAGPVRIRAGSGPGHEKRLLSALAHLGFSEGQSP